MPAGKSTHLLELIIQARDQTDAAFKAIAQRAQQLDRGIKTAGKGFQAAGDQISGTVNHIGSQLSSVAQSFTGTVDPLSAGFNQVTTAATAMQSVVASAAGKFAPLVMAIPIVTGLGAASAFLAKSLESASKETETLANLQLAWKGLNRGTEQDLDNVTGSLRAMSKTGLASFTEMAGAFKFLAASGRIPTDQILNAIQTAKDLSAYAGTGLMEAARAISYAGMGYGRVLRQFGLAIDPRVLKEEGVVGAIREISKVVGGAEAAKMERYAGATELLSKRLSELGKPIGKAVEETLGPVIRDLAGFFAALGNEIRTASETGALDAWKAKLSTVFEGTGDFVKQMAQGLKDFVQSDTFERIVDSLLRITDGFRSILSVAMQFTGLLKDAPAWVLQIGSAFTVLMGPAQKLLAVLERTLGLTAGKGLAEKALGAPIEARFKQLREAGASYSQANAIVQALIQRSDRLTVKEKEKAVDAAWKAYRGMLDAAMKTRKDLKAIEFPTEKPESLKMQMDRTKAYYAELGAVTSAYYESERSRIWANAGSAEEAEKRITALKAVETLDRLKNLEEQYQTESALRKQNSEKEIRQAEQTNPDQAVTLKEQFQKEELEAFIQHQANILKVSQETEQNIQRLYKERLDIMMKVQEAQISGQAALDSVAAKAQTAYQNLQVSIQRASQETQRAIDLLPTQPQKALQVAEAARQKWVGLSQDVKTLENQLRDVGKTYDDFFREMRKSRMITPGARFREDYMEAARLGDEARAAQARGDQELAQKRIQEARQLAMATAREYQGTDYQDAATGLVRQIEALEKGITTARIEEAKTTNKLATDKIESLNRLIETVWQEKLDENTQNLRYLADVLKAASVTIGKAERPAGQKEPESKSGAQAELTPAQAAWAQIRQEQGGAPVPTGATPSGIPWPTPPTIGPSEEEKRAKMLAKMEPTRIRYTGNTGIEILGRAAWLLEHGTPEEYAAELKKAIIEWGPGSIGDRIRKRIPIERKEKTQTRYSYDVLSPQAQEMERLKWVEKSKKAEAASILGDLTPPETFMSPVSTAKLRDSLDSIRAGMTTESQESLMKHRVKGEDEDAFGSNISQFGDFVTTLKGLPAEIAKSATKVDITVTKDGSVIATVGGGAYQGAF